MFDRTGRSFFKFGRTSPKRLTEIVSPPQLGFTSALEGSKGAHTDFGYFGSNHAGPNRCLPYLTIARSHADPAHCARSMQA
jgi:hypothetical protein